MRWWISGWAGTVLLLQLSGAWAGERESVVGRWLGDRSILEIAERDGTLSARVIALDDPVYREGEESGPVGSPRRDDRNPDQSKRRRPLLGMELLQDYRFEDHKWCGRIYDPESGNVYLSTMHVEPDGTLQMRGYVGIPMFGRTAKFEPLPACVEPANTVVAWTELVAQLQMAACE